MTTQVYISDTNIWIDFRNADVLDELFRLPFRLCCTDFVLGELKDLPTQDLVAQGLIVETLEGSAIGELHELCAAHHNSSLADVSCYYLAVRTGRPLLTGDGRLRAQAARDGIEIFGALWLLDRLVENALLPRQRAAKALQAMLDHGARLPHAECQQPARLGVGDCNMKNPQANAHADFMVEQYRPSDEHQSLPATIAFSTVGT